MSKTQKFKFLFALVALMLVMVLTGSCQSIKKGVSDSLNKMAAKETITVKSTAEIEKALAGAGEFSSFTFKFEYTPTAADFIKIRDAILTAEKEVALDLGATSLKVIPDNAFYISGKRFAFLTELVLPETLMKIGASAFRDCYALGSITCNSIYPPILGDRNCFYGTSSSRKVNVLYTSMYAYLIAGYGNNNIIDKDKLTIVEVKTLAEFAPALEKAKAGSVIKLSCDLAAKDYETIKNAINTSKKNIILDLSNAWPKLLTIPDRAFALSNNAKLPYLIGVVLHNETKIIGKEAFVSCTGIKNLIIPNKLTTIKESAFQSCTALTSITIPASVTDIEKTAFRGCTSVNTITLLNSTPPTLGLNAFAVAGSNLKIQVPAVSLTTYKSNSEWSALSSKMLGY